ncbi:hypothetical protein AB1Y20_023149 [Prymnesium parvum]|uniref:Methyltransferase FkbM domain-containing protein n=1 Tax=Prymnesium parvum TaxID=97485 RepID=A0AB34JFD4_PRYPA
MSETRPQPCRVRKESIFNSLLVGLLMERGLVPAGSVIDAGAHTGTETCLYAQAAPERTVHAVEPLYMNARRIQASLRHLPNVQVIQAGLGETPSVVRPSSGMLGVGQMFTPGKVREMTAVKAPSNTSDESATHKHASQVGKNVFSRLFFQVHRVDDLFAHNWKGEKLGFAHFDVEGMELAVLQGAAATIRRDSPWFTTELFVHHDQGWSSYPV